MNTSLLSYICAPIIWCVFALIVVITDIIHVYSKIFEKIENWLDVPEYKYDSYWDYNEKSQAEHIAEQYGTAMKDKMHGVLDIETLEIYARKVDRLFVKGYLLAENYQKLIDLYYKKLEELESLEVVDQALTRRRM